MWLGEKKAAESHEGATVTEHLPECHFFSFINLLPDFHHGGGMIHKETGFYTLSYVVGISYLN